ncbi:lysophospholipid acyltransferase family protein [bacterium]|nr:lysophospholipid acyltransferase family protein [candidate division CSSED10-310 bacterium]
MSYGVRLLLFLTRLLPRDAALRLGAGMGAAAWRLLPAQRRSVLRNLDTAYGDTMDHAGKMRIGRECFRHLGQALMECLLLPRLGKEGLDRVMVVEGQEVVEHLKQGGPAIFFSGHLGNFEYLGAYVGSHGFPVTTIVRENPHSQLGRLMFELRSQWNLNPVHRDDRSTKQIIQDSIAENRVLGILPDQDSRKVRGVFVPYFGTLAYTPSGPMALALRHHLPTYLLSTHRLPDNRHYLRFEGPLDLVDTGDFETDVTTNTAMLISRIEEKVRAHPEQWVWVHNRWRTRPPDESRLEGGTP